MVTVTSFTAASRQGDTLADHSSGPSAGHARRQRLSRHRAGRRRGQTVRLATAPAFGRGSSCLKGIFGALPGTRGRWSSRVRSECRSGPLHVREPRRPGPGTPPDRKPAVTCGREARPCGYSPHDSKVGRGGDPHRRCRRGLRVRLIARLRGLLAVRPDARAGRSPGGVVVSVPRASHAVVVLCHQPQGQGRGRRSLRARRGGPDGLGGGDTSTWPTFSALHCQPTSQSTTTALVYCTFSESQAPAVGNPDSFWTVELQRQPDGRWLISSYGQG
jgi:hypothetical protein